MLAIGALISTVCPSARVNPMTGLSGAQITFVADGKTEYEMIRIEQDTATAAPRRTKRDRSE
jgi:hypothetical protein